MTRPSPVPLREGGAQSSEDRATAAILAELPPADSDDIAVARVWRRLMAPPETSRRMVWAAVGALVATCVGALIPFLLRPSAPAEVMLSQGGVYSTRPAEAWSPAAHGQALDEGQRVRSDTSGKALLRIAGVATVLLAPSSDVAMEQLSQGTVLRLSRGALTARVLKRKPGEPFIVETDRYTVRVVGTLFTVSQALDGAITVSVREGTVEVLDQSTVIARVTAGMRWTSDHLAPPGADHTSDRVVSVLEDGLTKHASTLATRFEAIVPADDLPAPPHAAMAPVPPPEEPLVPPPAPVREKHEHRVNTPSVMAPLPHPVERAPEPVQPAPVPVALPTPPPIVVPPMGAPAPVVAPVVPPPAPVVAPVIPPPAPAPVLAAPPAPPQRHVEPVAAPYERALELEQKQDLRGAANQYELAAASDSEHAEDALYALGRLSMKLGDSARALKAFRSYQERFPHGTYGPEADFEMLEIEVDHGRPEELIQLATRFLDAHPDHPRAQKVRLIRGQQLEKQGQYEKAMLDFRAVSRPELLENAVYWIGFCQEKLGRKDAAAATLRDYLARFPKGKHREQVESALDEE